MDVTVCFVEDISFSADAHLYDFTGIYMYINKNSNGISNIHSHIVVNVMLQFSVILLETLLQEFGF